MKREMWQKMKISLGVFLVLPTICEPSSSSYGWHSCPKRNEYYGRCFSSGVTDEDLCPEAPSQWCSYYNYKSKLRKRPCACYKGYCRNRNGTCVLCKDCDTCIYRGKELSDDDYTYFDNPCERALCSFKKRFVERCSNPKPQPYGSCVYKRAVGRYPKCCEWVRAC
ncbi:uncharacterized protein LOC125945863 [Dermacentor silvarum]|uniref:uncharacterized protein LOC125945863 n=1 Tax=Dermacentor silvarum TaxID=543639 RepID=UPI0021008E55|nr:uncharacterized protein LOC125945863 [Dermacentor silvarum]